MPPASSMLIIMEVPDRGRPDTIVMKSLSDALMQSPITCGNAEVDSRIVFDGQDTNKLGTSRWANAAAGGGSLLSRQGPAPRGCDRLRGGQRLMRGPSHADVRGQRPYVVRLDARAKHVAGQRWLLAGAVPVCPELRSGERRGEPGIVRLTKPKTMKKRRPLAQLRRKEGTDEAKGSCVASCMRCR